jgi:hypothetical protein
MLLSKNCRDIPALRLKYENLIGCDYAISYRRSENQSDHLSIWT